MLRDSRFKMITYQAFHQTLLDHRGDHPMAVIIHNLVFNLTFSNLVGEVLVLSVLPDPGVAPCSWTPASLQPTPAARGWQ